MEKPVKRLLEGRVGNWISRNGEVIKMNPILRSKYCLSIINTIMVQMLFNPGDVLAHPINSNIPSPSRLEGFMKYLHLNMCEIVNIGFIDLSLGTTQFLST